jgi:molybdenum cofactor synthesis domain-containing protein
LEISNIKLEEKKGGKSDIKYAYPETLKVAVITCSDSISNRVGVDKSGDIVVAHLKNHKLGVAYKKVIADDFDTIQHEAKQLISDGFQLILFTGGTGLSKRDVTPDAIKPLIDREVPGVMEVARDYGQQRTPYAMLSRGIAGFAGDSLLITLPGSPKGAEESMQVIFPYILHVFRVNEGVKH